ncbi:unnamed protein product [Periconia digitata]|uniref:Uncharacterized protein n=1 Tax=Periconia digitata TaxID=1303443 RepID=A0A9W4UJG2_9PLEO|nr:unnamed protein product [Periconia digitata]
MSGLSTSSATISHPKPICYRYHVVFRLCRLHLRSRHQSFQSASQRSASLAKPEDFHDFPKPDRATMIRWTAR